MKKLHVIVESCARCPLVGPGMPWCAASTYGVDTREPVRSAVEKSSGYHDGIKKPPPKSCPLRSAEVTVRIGGGK